MKYNLKGYWWSDPCEKNVFNFCDLLTPLLLQHYSKDLKITPEKWGRATVYGAGSIIPAINPDKFSVLLGCGSLSEKRIELPNVLIYALRGELSKKMLQLEEDIPLGDPGLLTPYVLPAKSLITHNENKPIGIIPHFKQYANKRLDDFRNDSKYKIINVRAEAECVVRDICSCSSIISSSLHGLIIADAYRIPNIRLVFEDNLFDVNDFKFNDYFSSIKRYGSASKSIIPEQIDSHLNYSTEYFINIDSVQNKLDKAFKKFVRDLPLIQSLAEVETLISKVKPYKIKSKLHLKTIISIAKNNSCNAVQLIQNVVKNSDLENEINKRLRYYRLITNITFGKKRTEYEAQKGSLKQFLNLLHTFLQTERA